MSRDLNFYATKADLLPLFALVGEGLQYVRTGIYPSSVPETFSSGLLIPNLGIANNESAISCDNFLVSDENIRIVPRSISPFNGLDQFAFDQLNNPNTITFSPGGIWDNDILLHGRISTMSEDKSAVRIMKLFSSAIRKLSTKIKAFYVGPEALEMLRQGKRLTIAAQSPSTFDLKI
jgi:hypothetical protein